MVAEEKKYQAADKPAVVQKEFPQMQGPYGMWRHSRGGVNGQQSWERSTSRRRLCRGRRKVKPGGVLPSKGEGQPLRGQEGGAECGPW